MARQESCPIRLNLGMKKIIFQEFISLDGYAADAANSTAFFEERRFGQGSDEDLLAEMDNFDTILLGANTYKMFVEFWPGVTNDMEIMADKLNSIPKIVFSKSLQKAPWGKWPDAEIIHSDAVSAARKLKTGTGKNMVLWGSISLAQVFMKENLIDEYHLRIVPKLLGAGRLLFVGNPFAELELIESKKYPSGLLLAKYNARVG